MFDHLFYFQHYHQLHKISGIHKNMEATHNINGQCKSTKLNFLCVNYVINFTIFKIIKHYSSIL